jgi:cell division protein FtsL
MLLRMKRSLFITLFVSVHILFVLLIIHKQNNFIALSYENQRTQKRILELQDSKKILLREQYALTSHEHVKKFAQTKLGLEPVKMSQIKRLVSERLTP